MTDSQKIGLAELFSLRGKTAIVTGGTGGIGLELSSTLAEAGAKIVSIQLPDDRASGALSSAIASKVEIYECDMTDSKALRATFAQMWKDDVVPDILLNCAGVNRRKAAVDFTDEEIDTIWAVNLKASYVAGQEVGRELLRLGRPGKIINVASVIGFVGNHSVSAYACSKGGVLQMTRAFSNEWASKGIQVNAISPGYVKTALTEPLTRDTEYSNYILGRTPAGRWGVPEDLRGAVIFLASAASGWVTGISLAVDGGFLAK